MHGAGLSVDLLQRREPSHRRCDLLSGKATTLGDDRGRPDRFCDGVDAADAAAGRTRDLAPPLADALGPGGCKPHPQLDAIVEVDDVERKDLVRRLYDAFAEAEADRKVLEIMRRRHHHGIGAAIIGQRDRRLLWHKPCAALDAPAAPGPAVDHTDRFVHPPHSAASTTGRMRREWRACSSYAFCQSDGPFDGEICTAVTLYSGQLVAQSEYSVVITLACVSGWWKVV